MLKRFLLGLSLAVGVLLLAPAPEAEARRGWHGGNHRHGGNHSSTHQVRRHGSGFSTPELDPSAAGGAVILLLGGVAYIASRRREEDLA